MSEKNYQNAPTKAKAPTININKNKLEKTKIFFKILALYIAPIIGSIFLPLIIHYQLLEKIYSLFSNNNIFMFSFIV